MNSIAYGFDKFTKAANKVIELLCIVILIVIVIASFLQVFTRYVLSAALTGSEEVGRYCFIWVSCLGASLAVGQWAHPSISILPDQLKGTGKQVWIIIANVIVIITSMLLLVYGIKLMTITTKQLSSITRIPMCFIYLSLPVGALGMIINAVNNILTGVFGKEASR